MAYLIGTRREQPGTTAGKFSSIDPDLLTMKQMLEKYIDQGSTNGKDAADANATLALLSGFRRVEEMLQMHLSAEKRNDTFAASIQRVEEMLERILNRSCVNQGAGSASTDSLNCVGQGRVNKMQNRVWHGYKVKKTPNAKTTRIVPKVQMLKRPIRRKQQTYRKLQILKLN